MEKKRQQSASSCPLHVLLLGTTTPWESELVSIVSH